MKLIGFLTISKNIVENFKSYKGRPNIAGPICRKKPTQFQAKILPIAELRGWLRFLQIFFIFYFCWLRLVELLIPHIFLISFIYEPIVKLLIKL